MDITEFEEHAPRLRAAVTAMVAALPGGVGRSIAEDVAQETLMKLWMIRERLDEYRSLDSLAIVVARRCAIDILRRDSRMRSLSDNVSEAGEEESPETSFIVSEELRGLLEVISSLPSLQQAVVRMKHIEGLETREIARITGSTEGAIRVALSRARRSIKDIFMQQQ